MLQFILLQDAAATDGGSGGGGFMNILFIVLIFVVFYFFMIRPQQKRQKEIRKFRESLDRGSKIVTAGGIKGTITKVNENDFEVEITKGVTVNVAKSCVYQSDEDATQSQQQK